MIVGYTALLDPVAMGHAFEVLVNVDLTNKDRDAVERFEADVAALDEVLEVRRMFGLPDYVVRVGVSDLDAYETFVTAGLGAVPGIAKVDSHLTMKVVKSPERPGGQQPQAPADELDRTRRRSDAATFHARGQRGVAAEPTSDRRPAADCRTTRGRRGDATAAPPRLPARCRYSWTATRA